MPSDARRKEKKRLKRQEKKEQRWKLQSRTALQRVSAEGGRLECWMTPENWKGAGILSLQILAHGPAGRGAFAAFLIDLWAVGLKDAFGRSDLPAMRFREENMESWIERTGAVTMDEGNARRLIAGAIRFSRQNGFRLPPGWEKWTALFGRDFANEIATADLCDFGIDGGLRYVGDIDFLRKRLINGDPKEFFARSNVHYVMEVSEAEALGYRPMEEDEDEDNEALEVGSLIEEMGVSHDADLLHQSDM